MTQPIEWKEADRVETTRVPGASARLVVRRQHFAGRMTTQDATPADLAAALDAIPAGERAAVLQAFGSDPEMRAALLTDCAVAYGKVAAAEAERDKALAERDDCFKKGVELVIELNAALAERDEARRHLCNERNGAAGLRDALATMKKERDEARGQCAQVAAERDAAADRAERFAVTAEEWRHETIKVQAERDALRTELRAREWLDAQSNRNSPLLFIGRNGVPLCYVSYAAAARALGWEG